MYILDLSFEYRYRVALCISMVLFLIFSTILVAQKGQTSTPALINLPSPAAEFNAHFHLELNQSLNDIASLSIRPHQMVGGVDLDLYTGIQQAQNSLFDLVAFEGEDTILIDFAVPANIQENEVDQFITYQALNYAFVLSRLMPHQELRHLKIKAFRRGVTVDYKEYNYWFDLNALQSLEGVSFKRAYKKINSGIKKNLMTQ